MDHYNSSTADNGDTIVISVLVENTGDAPGEQTISMTVGADAGGAAGDQEIALDAGESGEVTSEVDRSELGGGLATSNADSREDGLNIAFNVSDI